MHLQWNLVLLLMLRIAFAAPGMPYVARTSIGSSNKRTYMTRAGTRDPRLFKSNFENCLNAFDKRSPITLKHSGMIAKAPEHLNPYTIAKLPEPYIAPKMSEFSIEPNIGEIALARASVLNTFIQQAESRELAAQQVYRASKGYSDGRMDALLENIRKLKESAKGKSDEVLEWNIRL